MIYRTRTQVSDPTAPNGDLLVFFTEINMPSDLVELGDSNPRPPACKEQAVCGMP